MKTINVDSHNVPATARSRNYQTALATTASSGGGATTPSTVTPTGGAADTAKVAQNLAEDSTDWKKILRKDIDERTENALSIGKNLTVDGQAILNDVVANTGTFSGLLKAAAATITGALLASTVSATTIDATTFIGELQGNAATATKLKTARTIWGQSFDGSSDVYGLFTNQDVHIGYGNEIFTTNSPLYLNYAERGSQPVLMCTGLGNVGIGPTNPLYKLDVNGNARIASDLYLDATVGTRNFASRTVGWNVNSNGAADFRNLYADELRVQAFTADISQALAGSDYLTKSVSKLSANFVVPSVNSTVRIIVDDIEGMPATQCFANGDYIRFRAFNRTSGLTIANVWGTVTLDTTFGTNGFSNGTQAYTFTCTQTTGAGLTVFKGSEVLDYGISGSGIIARTTLDAMGSPYEQIATWKNDPSNGNNYTVHARLGNLGGIANCNGYGLYTDNGFFTGKITVGDLTKSNHYLDFSNGSLTVKGDVYLSNGDGVVGSNGVISAINLTRETATIQASKINLIGAVTIGSIDKSSVTPSSLGAATPTDVSTAVNGIQIGGRNLFISGGANTKKVTISGGGDGSDELYIQTDIHAYLKAGTQYIFSCNTDGEWGGGAVGIDTVEAYLLLDNMYNTYYHMDSNAHIFTPSVSGAYYLRLDVNQNNKTHWFSDIQIEEGNKKTTYAPAPEDVAQDAQNKVDALSRAHGGLTYLDDHSIYTGTLTAKQINVVGIDASYITAGTLNADRIDVNNVSARIANVISLDAGRIKTGILSADRIDVANVVTRGIAAQTIDAQSATISNLNVVNATVNGYFHAEYSGGAFARIGQPTSPEILAIRADGLTGIDIGVYGDNSTGLSITANGNSSKALDIYGSSYLITRQPTAPEGTWINGLSLCRVTITSGGDLGSGSLGWYHNGGYYMPNFIVSKATSTIQVNIPSDMPDGAVLIFRNAGDGTINVSSRNLADKFQWGAQWDNWSRPSASVAPGVLNIFVYDKSSHTWYVHGIS